MCNDLNTSSKPVESPLDALFLLNQVGGNIETARLVAEEFTNLAPMDQEQLGQWLDLEDLSAAGKLAFYLRGTYCVLGATRLCALIADLEAACGKNDKTAANETYQKFREEIARCVDSVPTLIQQRLARNGFEDRDELGDRREVKHENHKPNQCRPENPQD